MTNSPFEGFDNAVLHFQVPTGTYTTNALGNRVPQYSNITIRAVLRTVRNIAQIQYYLGADEAAELMQGYLVDPLNLSDNLHAPVEGEAEIKIATGIIESGTFRLLPEIQSPYLVGTRINMVNKITGIFKKS